MLFFRTLVKNQRMETLNNEEIEKKYTTVLFDEFHYPRLRYFGKKIFWLRKQQGRYFIDNFLWEIFDELVEQHQKQENYKIELGI